MLEPIKKLWRMPRGLGEYGKIFYKKAGEYLVKEAILTDLDKIAFVRLCSQYDTIMKIKEQIHRELPFPKDKIGREKEKLFISSYRSTLSGFEYLSAEFYLTPKIRASLKIDPNLSLVKRKRKRS